MSAELTKVDSAIAGLSISAKDEKAPDKEAKKGHRRTSSDRRTSSSTEEVWNIKDLEAQKIDITLPIETQKTGWKLNTSPSTIEDKDILKLKLVNPPVKKIDLHFPLGLEVTARNLKGVTIKDALDAIHKQFKKKADDELDQPYLAGFEWDKDECWTRLIVHQTKQGPPQQSSKKSKKKKDDA
ncbi:hypothetical protein EYZ11_002286 [Aspergillus tanneri]|uniref:DUF6699 domain-containing protein n=1 Tax=Aspergillus tanneri TaxID=1220188 RepID=A0A4V3UQ97_9EURO|nr:uncharacterized protein ATNIH1004_001135 [Aspergillus tanneri]KAA8652231.1 hypothetical protein ATNIH1004_001135 [Aspergillus tanneri]THC98204.1 hypothetical protein EYZ11_002286 [Aspergillus tanneri]